MYRSLANLRSGVQASAADSLSLRWDCPQELDAWPNQHRLRRISSKDSSPDLQASRATRGKLLADLSVQLHPLPMAYHQVVPTEARKDKCGPGLCKDISRG